MMPGGVQVNGSYFPHNRKVTASQNKAHEYL